MNGLDRLPPEIERFVAFLEGERRASAHTVKAYVGDLAQYAAHLAESKTGLVPSSPSAIRGFLSRASARSGPATLARKLSAVRAFYRFLVREGLAEGNPARALASPKRKVRLPEVLAEDEGRRN